MERKGHEYFWNCDFHALTPRKGNFHQKINVKYVTFIARYNSG